MAIVMREVFLYNVAEYKDKLEPYMHQMKADGKWESVEREVIPNYAFKKNGILFKLKKSLSC